VDGEETINTFLYENIPTTGSTTASIQLGGDIITPLLVIDVNGDGTADVSIGDGEDASILSLEILEDIIGEMDIQRGLKKDLMEAVKKAIKELERGKTKKAAKELDKLIKKLQKEIKKNMKERERDENDKHEKDEDEHKNNKEKGVKISTEDAQRLIQIVEKVKENVI